MAISNCIQRPLKPGQALGFFILGAIFMGLLLLALQGREWCWAKEFQLSDSNRVPFFAAWTALVATLWAAKVGVENLVRQHTVNTLLQSRLSDVFMSHGKAMNKGNDAYEAAPCPKNRRDRYIRKESLVYMLNFYEYVAVGIKHGDLSEEVMSDMLRGVVMAMTDRYADFIRDAQSLQPRAFVNLVALANKWKAQIAIAAAADANARVRSLRSGLPAHESKRFQ